MVCSGKANQTQRSVGPKKQPITDAVIDYGLILKMATGKDCEYFIFLMFSFILGSFKLELMQIKR